MNILLENKSKTLEFTNKFVYHLNNLKIFSHYPNVFLQHNYQGFHGDLHCGVPKQGIIIPGIIFISLHP